MLKSSASPLQRFSSGRARERPYPGGWPGERGCRSRCSPVQSWAASSSPLSCQSWKPDGAAWKGWRERGREPAGEDKAPGGSAPPLAADQATGRLGLKGAVWRAGAESRMRSTAPLRLLALAAVAGLARGSPASCALHSPLEGGGRQLLQVSDGQVLLSATWQPGLPGLDGCRLTVEAQAVAAFLQRCEQQKQQPESTKTTTDAFPSLEAAKAACLSFQPDGGLAFASRRRAKRGFTYPGTLWCGAGDMAESYDQLGKGRSTGRATGFSPVFKAPFPHDASGHDATTFALPPPFVIVSYPGPACGLLTDSPTHRSKSNGFTPRAV